MDPLSVGISAAGGLLSSVFGGISQKKILEAQQRENELNRQFNHDEAELSRQFNERMWNAQNEYSDPSSVVARLQRAGLNPALAFGGFDNGSLAASGGVASSSGSVNPGPLDTSGIQSAGNAYMNSKLLEAQTRLANSEAGRNEAEIPWVDRLNMSVVDLNRSVSGLNVSNMIRTDKLTDKEAAKLDADINLLRNKADEVIQNARLLDASATGVEIRNMYEHAIKSNEVQQGLATIKKTFSEANLNDRQAYDLACTLSSRLGLMNAETGKLNSETKTINFDFDVKSMVGSLKLAEVQSRSIEAELLKLQSEAEQARFQADNIVFSTWTSILGGVADTVFGAIASRNATRNSRAYARSKGM